MRELLKYLNDYKKECVFAPFFKTAKRFQSVMSEAEFDGAEDGMVERQRDNELLRQGIVRFCEMPPDGHEHVEVVAPVPLSIEHPASAVRRQSETVRTADGIARMFVAAAAAVADAILVSSGFENGEGHILVRLQPEVLGGSEVQITAKGGTLTVIVNPASQDVQKVVEANRTQFEQYLAEKVHSWRIAVAVKKGDDTDGRV